MRRAVRTIRALHLTILLVLLGAGAAHAGHWSVIYDLAPGRSLATNAPGGPFNDPITGTLTIEYDAVSTGAPLSGARLVTGMIANTISQPAGILTVTGSNMNVLSPPPGGTPGTLMGATLNLAVVADHTLTGFLHCYDATGPGGVCGLVFSGVDASNPIPQSASGPFSLPNFVFAGGTAGFGDWTAPTVTSTPQGTITTMTVYAGREISRVWVADTPVPSMGAIGLGALVLCVPATGGLALTRRR